ncbi:MAG: hypothetical protein ACLUIC_09415, partial [Oscillospiraceae bacterium]
FVRSLFNLQDTRSASAEQIYYTADHPLCQDFFELFVKSFGSLNAASHTALIGYQTWQEMSTPFLQKT